MEKKIEELKAALTGANATAAELLNHKYHGQSSAVAAMRARIGGALEMLEAHGLWLTQNPPAETPNSNNQAPAKKQAAKSN